MLNSLKLPILFVIIGGGYFLYRASQNSIGTIFDRDVVGTWVLFISVILAVDLAIFQVVKKSSGVKKSSKIFFWFFVILIALVFILFKSI